jgi:hypothetical protein
MPLEGGEPGQYGDQQFALRGTGVVPRIVERFELGAFLCELVEGIKQVPRTAG